MVRLFSSSAIRNPNTEIIRAVVFKNHGIVRTGKKGLIKLYFISFLINIILIIILYSINLE